MSDTQQGNGDRGGGPFNGLVVFLLVVVGAMGAWIMFSSLYAPASLPSQAVKDATGTGALATKIQSGMDSMMSRSGSGYAIQLTPYSEMATADEVRAKLDKLGIPSSLRVEAQVQVGPFRSHEEAEAARAKLKELGVYGGQVITLKP